MTKEALKGSLALIETPPDNAVVVTAEIEAISAHKLTPIDI